MIVIDELPLGLLRVRDLGFTEVCCPRFKILSRWTVSWNIHFIYEEEMLKLKQFFTGNT